MHPQERKVNWSYLEVHFEYQLNVPGRKEERQPPRNPMVEGKLVSGHSVLNKN